MPPDSDKQLPDNSLRPVRNARSWLIVCFCTFPIYIVAVSVLVQEGRDVTSFMLLYMLLYAGFGIFAATRRCPRCQRPFYVKSMFLNIFRTKCAHCGLALKGARGEDSPPEG